MRPVWPKFPRRARSIAAVLAPLPPPKKPLRQKLPPMTINGVTRLESVPRLPVPRQQGWNETSMIAEWTLDFGSNGNTVCNQGLGVGINLPPRDIGGIQPAAA